MSKPSLPSYLLRRSCRNFLEDPLPQEAVISLLEAMRAAPSAGNLQPWRFIIVSDPDVKRGLAAGAHGQDFLAQAPTVFVVCAVPEESATVYGERGRRLYAFQDTAAAIQNLLLAAEDLGLGSCWVGAFDDAEISRLLDLPDRWLPVALVPVGKPGERPARTSRRPLEDVTRWVTGDP